MPDIRARARGSAPAAAPSRASPGPVKGGTTMIAFVADPDGYKDRADRARRLSAAAR
jgi:hypothetical protein